jgi:glycosyltransferase involved in cell wall biosynthesis
MNIMLLTDNLSSGGAQRQLCLLGAGLRKTGHDVALVTYRGGDFFEEEAAAAGIARIRLGRVSRLLRPAALAAVFREKRPAGIIAFQSHVAFYAEWAVLGRKRCPLIVSERSCRPRDRLSFAMKILPHFHHAADFVTTNSIAMHTQMTRHYPHLARKMRTIYNAVDLNRFQPGPDERGRFPNRFVVAASHKPAKNFAGLAKAVRRLKDLPGRPDFQVDWYGGEAEAGWLARDEKMRRDLDLGDVLHLHPPAKNMETIFRRADALILPSFWEGLPNAVCEALAAGCPVLIGDIGDAREILAGGKTGFLFDPASEESMARAIKKYMDLAPGSKTEMRREARVFAESHFDPDRMAAGYLALIEEAREKRRT